MFITSKKKTVLLKELITERFFREHKMFFLWHRCETILLKPLFLRMHTLFTTNTLLQAWEDHNQPYLFPWRATVHEFQFNKGKLGRLGCPIADSNWSGRSTKSSPPLLPGFSVNKRSLPTCERKHRVGVIENALLWCCLILNTEINSMLNVLKILSTSPTLNAPFMLLPEH